MKKKLHIIPHTHWDREWYMPFEEHRYRLVELFDDILEVFDKDENFKYYHMDGQVIPVLDYLEIKPENRQKVLKLIKENKLQIGPWYILQDEYLTSGESQIRNMELGINIAKELGADPVMTGYFPDSFGNMSQAPQILNKFNIDSAFFGRGLNEVGFDNQVIEQKGINKSELIWKSPDGSKVTSVLFANWYCNANGLPEDLEGVRERFDEIINRATPFSHLDDILGMNGCDHTPLQRNLSKIIAEANKNNEKYEVVHSSIKDYIEIIKKDTSKYQKVTGEICGQLTTGYNLLLNTASTRIDIKQLNHKNENTMLFEAEPLATLNSLLNKCKYPHEYFKYFWKLFLQNHPHDSACSCNVDPVNTEVKTRHLKSHQVANLIASETLDKISLSIKNKSNNELLTVYNKDFKSSDILVKAYVDFDRDTVKYVYLKDEEGNKVLVSQNVEKNKFTYTLPKNSFRKVRYLDRFYIEFVAKNVPGLGYKSYKVYTTNTNVSNLKNDKNVDLSNEFVKLEFNQNGSFNLTNLKNNFKFVNQNYFEYTLDIGNEYNYEQSKDNYLFNTLNETPKIVKTHQDKVKQVVTVSYKFKIPFGVSDKVATKEMVDLKLVSTITLYNDLKYPIINTNVQSKGENFRLRAMFDTNLESKDVYSFGQFDLVKRDLIPWEGWKNPSNCGRSDGFVTFKDNTNGLVVSGHGLYEYEVVRQNKSHPIALTILKGINELGDWGIFPTPDSQMKGNWDLEYMVYPYEVKNMFECYNETLNFYHGVPRFSQTPKNNVGKENPKLELFNTENKEVILSSFKKAIHSNSYLLRIYSISEKNINLNLTVNTKLFKDFEIVNLNEDFIEKLELNNNILQIKFKPKEIITLRFKSKK